MGILGLPRALGEDPISVFCLASPFVLYVAVQTAFPDGRFRSPILPWFGFFTACYLLPYRYESSRRGNSGESKRGEAASAESEALREGFSQEEVDAAKSLLSGGKYSRACQEGIVSEQLPEGIRWEQSPQGWCSPCESSSSLCGSHFLPPSLLQDITVHFEVPLDTSSKSVCCEFSKKRLKVIAGIHRVDEELYACVDASECVWTLTTLGPGSSRQLSVVLPKDASMPCEDSEEKDDENQERGKEPVAWPCLFSKNVVKGPEMISLSSHDHDDVKGMIRQFYEKRRLK